MRVKSGLSKIFISVVFVCLCSFAAAAPTNTVSGFVLSRAGAGVEGVNVYGNNGATSTTTGADGSYSVTVPNNWDGTISASKSGWIMTPPSRAYSNLRESLANEDYLAWQPLISGTVTKQDGTPLQDVTITADNSGGTTVTNASGYFELYVRYEWIGNLSASLAGYSFTSKAVWYVTADTPNQNFVGFQPKISGYVKRTNGTPLEGATVNVNDGAIFTVTNANGYYELTVPYNWAGGLWASLEGYRFTEKAFTPVTANMTNENFTGFQPSIMGSTGVAGATVTASGIGTVISTPSYSFTVPYNWSGTVEVVKAAYHFNESPRTYSNVIANLTSQDFTPYQPKISGYVKKEDGTALSAVSLTANNGGGTTTTNTSGYYQLTLPYNWSGTILASRIGWQIEPQAYEYANVTSDTTNKNYQGVETGIRVALDGSGDFTTIQAAINAATDGNIIYVADGTYRGTGNRDINFWGKAITVQGNLVDPNLVIVDCQGSAVTPHRGFHFCREETSVSILEGFKIINGFALKDYSLDGTPVAVGGAVMCFYTSPTIRHCILSGNSAEYGAGICCSTGTISDCIVSGNSAKYGGGLYDCDGIIDNCVIISNSVVNGSGGGLYGCDGTVWNCSINHNSASNRGGGFCSCDAAINDCTIAGNSAQFGGGLSYGSGRVQNCTISNNSAAQDGGGLEYFNGAVQNCSVSGNTAANGSGGGLYNCDGPLENSAVRGNTAASDSYVDGGGGLAFCDGTILNCTISDNSVYLNAIGGGLLFCNGTIEDCVINNNYAYYGGGGFARCSGTITDCVISGNDSSLYGGGVYYSIAQILSCDITDNSAMDGGGLDNCEGRIWNCNISTNTASRNGGGVASCEILENCTISDNSADYGGGIYYCPLIENCFIRDNSAEQGGAIYYGIDNIDGVIRSSVICGNSAATHGGGFYDYDGEILNCTISGNSAIYGGGLYDCKGIIKNNIIWGNNDAQGTQVRDSDTPNYCCIEDWTEGGQGNIALDPLLLEDGYHLSGGSPCIDAGDPDDLADPKVDIDGDTRVYIRTDIGADEVYSDVSPFIVTKPGLLIFTTGLASSPIQSQKLSITNYGRDTLNWSIDVAPTCQWATIEPNSGVLLAGSDEVTVYVDPALAGYGLHSCQLTVSDPNAANNPQTVTVTLNVLRPTIAVTPGVFNFECNVDDPNTYTQTLSISNSGYDSLSWQITENSGWLSVEPASGSCTTESNQVNVRVNTAGLEIGRYTANLTVTDINASNSPKIIPVNLHVYRDGERHVPTEYSDLPQAVAASVNGDHIIIHPGIYNGYGSSSISIRGKAVTIRSTEPDNKKIVERTIISQYRISLSGMAASGCVIEGLVFRDFLSRAIYSTDCSPIIRNCIFNSNSPSTYSACVHLVNSSAIVDNCEFTNTYMRLAKYCAGCIAISNNPDHHVMIRNCLISTCYNDFGAPPGISVSGGSADIVNCTIAYNTTSNIYEYTTAPGMLIHGADVTVRNTIIWGNRADDGSQIGVIVSGQGTSVTTPARLTISHSIVENGKSGIILFPDSDALRRYAESQQLPDPNLIDPNAFMWGPGNMDINPLFVRDANDGGDGWIDLWQTIDINENANNDCGDMHLKSQVGRFDWQGFADMDFNLDGGVNLIDFVTISHDWLLSPNASTFFDGDLNKDHFVNLADLLLFCEEYLQPRVLGQWVTDDVTSPCIDAGDPADIGWQNELWPHGGRINMGAYGGTPQASMSPNQVGMATDLNHDSFVDLVDWSLFSDDWLKMRPLLDSDFDLDSDVDPNDLTTFMDNWLTAAP